MRFIAGSIFLLLSSLSWAQSMNRLADDNLTQAQAKLRRQQVKDIHYELVFELEKGAETFKGKAILLLNLNNTKRDLSIDFTADKIESVLVNGTELRHFKQRLGSFDIPAAKLTAYSKLEIRYTSSFSKEPNGFQRSIDPEDKAEYLFTDFEPYYAHKLFPCLDQPDIKATYQVIVKGPADWRVIHNENPSNAVMEGDRKTTYFPTTKLFSTYLFFLGAGPYVEWKDTYQNIPLTLYARQTVAKYVDHQEIFSATKKGLEFFTNYFGVPYPFSKYGQIFIPEFAWGGMENPGAVALNERNIFRGPVPRATREGRDDLILHEMAHMWFGDLVTMEWWNDLWLNESFATYTASLANDRGLEAKGTWIDFFSTKTWGYWQDQLVTTHPIETLVTDVRSAKGNFDGITYAKGAAALKQLHFFVGEKGFKEGLQSYFKTYAFKNTRREDFINEIGKAAQLPLNDWTQKWLQTAGANRVKVKIQCQEGLVKELAVIQTASRSGTLSPHRTRLGLYELKDGALLQFRTHEVIYDKAVTNIKELEGTRCPDFILPNQDDQDFALFSLDPASLQHARLALSKLPDPLSRLMVWNMLEQMVRDGELAPLTYFDFADSGLQAEQDDLLLAGVIGRDSMLRNIYQRYLTKDERALKAPRLEEVLWQRVLTAPPASSLQMTFFDYYVTVVQTPEGGQRLKDMLVQATPPQGITLDQDRRWRIVTALARAGVLNADELIKQEATQDPSTMGKRMAYGARAAIPDAKIKAEYWKEFFESKDLAYSFFAQAAGRIHSSNYPELTESYVDAFFKRVTSMDWDKHESVADIYFEALFPWPQCSEKLLTRSQLEMKKTRRLSSLARRLWLEANDELGRCINVRKSVAQLKTKA